MHHYVLVYILQPDYIIVCGSLGFMVNTHPAPRAESENKGGCYKP